MEDVIKLVKNVVLLFEMYKEGKARKKQVS